MAKSQQTYEKKEKEKKKLKRKKKVFQNKIISFISGTVFVWIAWGLLPYDI